MRKESDSNILNCIICKEDRNFFSMGQCEHRGVCNYCAMKSRMLYKDLRCPICTSKLDYIFILEHGDRSSYSDLEKQKEYLYLDDDFKTIGIYYTTISAQEQALKLKNFICPITSCQELCFDNIQMLVNHLGKVHKRFFCETCLKEGKKFLSEMQIYNHDSLNEHITYGEFSNLGGLVVPPHPMCPFCHSRYFNDEQLFRHMNEHYFNCQICKDKKNIIFYRELSNLLDHYKSWHHVCPYQECLDNIYVVFETEEKLNAHLISKHKCTDTKSILTPFLFSAQNNFIDKKNSSNLKKNDFNFTNYINLLKENSKIFGENYLRNLGRNQENKLKSDKYDNYSNDNYNPKENNFNNSYYGKDYGNYYGKKGKNSKNSYSQYNQPQPQKPKGNNPNEIFNYFIQQENYSNALNNTDIGYNEVEYTYENDNTYNFQNSGYGKAKRGKNRNYTDNYSNFYETRETYVESQPIGLPDNKKKNKNNRHKKKEGEDIDNQDQVYFKEEKPQQIKLNVGSASFKPNSSAKNLDSKSTISNSNILKMNPNIEYKLVLKNWVFNIREYLKKKISDENIPESLFIIPAETIYQMIIIIDKLDKQNNLELQSLVNFGFDIDMHKEIRLILLSGFDDQETIKPILDRLEIKKILILYKYLLISSNKFNGLYYKLSFEMIEPDLYGDFVKKDQIKNKSPHSKRSNNIDLINLEMIENNKNIKSGLGKLTKKLEGFSFKDEKKKVNIPGFGKDSNIKIKSKNAKLKNLLTEEQINAEKALDEKNKILENQQINNEIPIDIPETNSQLKLLVEGKFTAPKKDIPTSNHPLKKKFKVNIQDLPSL